MKKILISIFVFTFFAVGYSEETYKYIGTDGEIYTMTESQVSMNQRWQRIKAMDAQIAFEPDKNKLKKIHDEYEKEFNVYMEYLRKNPG